MPKNLKPFSMAETVIGTLFLFTTDVFCALLDLTVVGAFITPFIQTPVSVFTTFWIKRKGNKNAMKMGRQMTKYAANLLPWIPTLTVFFIAEVVMHNKSAKNR